MFKAIIINKTEQGQTVQLSSTKDSDLPQGEVTVDVAWSSLNYKDALAITGKSPVVRSFPMVPGIDFAGVVSDSSNLSFIEGDRVLLNGWGVGEKHWGGFSEKARVNSYWLQSLPKEISMRRAMAIGTAGYTAMLCVMKLEDMGVTPEKGVVLVTGASGGVGSVAVLLLSKLGYQVCAVTGKKPEANYLMDLGAQSVIDREELYEPSRPLNKERWAGAIDVVGGKLLANVLSSIRYRGGVACCGLAGGMDLPSSVAPFILRGVTLAGVDSVQCPKDIRQEAWRRLAMDLDLNKLDAMTTEVPFEDIIEVAPQMLEGKVKGRIVIPISSRLG